MSDDEYTHPDHGDMIWVDYEARRKQIRGWKCGDCHVIAPPDRADTVFDECDCEDYENIRKAVAGGDDA